MDEITNETPQVENAAEDTEQVSQSEQAQEVTETEDALPPEQQRGYIARLKEKNEKFEKRIGELEKKFNDSTGKNDEVKEQCQKELQTIKDEY